MSQNEIETIIIGQYLSDTDSGFIKLRLLDNSVLYGEFFKCNQMETNIKGNKWVLSCVDGNFAIMGEEIKAIYLFKAKNISTDR